MPSTTIPGAGLQGYWAEGEGGWKPGMDENLARLSALVNLSVPSLTAPLNPGAGVQIAPAGHASAGAVSAYMNGAWWHYMPTAGVRAWVRDIKAWAVFDGTTWLRESSAAHVVSAPTISSRMITEAEFVAGAVIVVDSENPVVLTVPAPVPGAPDLGASTARRAITIIRAGTGAVSVAAAAGSTLRSADNAFSARAQRSMFTVAPVSASEYYVGGDLA